MSGGDPFRRVQPGQPLQIPAAAYNAFLDASAAYQRNQQTGVRSSGPELRSSTLIRVRNESNRDLKQFEVLGIDAPIFEPQDSLNAFRREVSFRGVLPDEQEHSGRFVVLQEPLPKNQVGLAVVVGLTIARLHDPENGPQGDYADCRHGEVTSVRRRSKPIAPIVWADEELGDENLRWVIIHLNPQPVRPTTTTTTCSPTNGFCVYQAEFDPEEPESTRWVLAIDEEREPVDRCERNYSCQPPSPDPTPDEAESGALRRTCCDTATTSTTTTPAPCSGSCMWSWNSGSKTWSVQSSDCGSQCACDAPGFCGEDAGETTRTDCISGGAPQPPYCGGSTTTCPPTTTSPLHKAVCRRSARVVRPAGSRLAIRSARHRPLAAAFPHRLRHHRRRCPVLAAANGSGSHNRTFGSAFQATAARMCLVAVRALRRGFRARTVTAGPPHAVLRRQAARRPPMIPVDPLPPQPPGTRRTVRDSVGGSGTGRHGCWIPPPAQASALANRNQRFREQPVGRCN